MHIWLMALRYAVMRKKNYKFALIFLESATRILENTDCLFAPGCTDARQRNFSIRSFVPVLPSGRAVLKTKNRLVPAALHLLRPFLLIDMMKFPLVIYALRALKIFSWDRVSIRGKIHIDIKIAADSFSFSTANLL